MQQRRETHLWDPFGGFPYTFDPRRSVFNPALCPARWSFEGVPSDYTPSLHCLRRIISLFGNFSGIMGVSDFSSA